VFCPDLFAKTDAKAESLGIQRKQRSEAVKTITKMVVHTGKDLDELTADDVLDLRSWCLRELGGTPQGVVLAWVLVRGIADLGPSATLQEAVRLGQRPTIEIVDRYGFRDSNVRKVLLRYLDERRPGMHHNSFQNLVAALVGLFWADIERHHPELDTLHLPSDVAEAWKQRARTIPGAGGARRRARQPRLLPTPHPGPRVLPRHSGMGDGGPHLGPVGGTQPGAAWRHRRIPQSTPTCHREHASAGQRPPPAAANTRANRRTASSRPGWPLVGRRRDAHRRNVRPPITRIPPHHPPSYEKSEYRDTTPPVLVEGLATGERINLSHTEDEAFWSWAIVERCATPEFGSKN
jgi:hypothetical protein